MPQNQTVVSSGKQVEVETCSSAAACIAPSVRRSCTSHNTNHQELEGTYHLIKDIEYDGKDGYINESKQCKVWCWGYMRFPLIEVARQGLSKSRHVHTRLSISPSSLESARMTRTERQEEKRSDEWGSGERKWGMGEWWTLYTDFPDMGTTFTHRTIFRLFYFFALFSFLFLFLKRISFNLGLLQTFLIIHMCVYITVETISHRPMPLEYSYFFYVF